MSDYRSENALEALKKFDTPSITNVVATYPTHPLCLGLYNPWTENWYTDQTIKCIYPDLGRTVGYAVTCVFGLPEPGFKNLSFIDVINALDESQKPSILVIQQKFPPEIAGKVGLAGGNMTASAKAVSSIQLYTSIVPYKEQSPDEIIFAKSLGSKEVCLEAFDVNVLNKCSGSTIALFAFSQNSDWLKFE